MKVLSFHPLYEGDDYRICAGRDPGREELAAIQAADAVVLPQACRERLYRMARENCEHVFPNYDARFRYPRKPDQIRLFRDAGAAHRAAETFDAVADFRARYNGAPGDPAVGYPLVFKFAWGGEGETVFLADGPERLAELTALAEAYEETGQRGFLLQTFVPPGDRTFIHLGFRDRRSMVSRPSWARIREVPLGFTTPVSFFSGAYPPGASSTVVLWLTVLPVAWWLFDS